MKSIGSMLNVSPKPKQMLSKKTKAMFTRWALEAYELDKTRSVSYYYNLFLDNLRKHYSKETKEQFFKHGIIEV